MKKHQPFLFISLLLIPLAQINAQMSLSLSSVIPGTEKVQLVYNGDFQATDAAVSNTFPSPVGWTRQAGMVAGPGTNTVQANHGVVAQARVTTSGEICQFQRNIQLLPNTEYVLSAYLWNMGDMDNNTVAVIDMNDCPDEPQMTLLYDEEDADKGCFVYSTFNTRYTGSNVTLRIFCDTQTGKGAAPKYYPVAAQWDNLAITKASNFEPPQPNGGSGNLRPVVSITSPVDEAKIVSSNAPASLKITAAAADYDGTITKVEFYAGTNKLGQATKSPYSLLWTDASAGSYQLTAVATDDKKAMTVSAPVTITVTTPAMVKSKN